MKFDNNNYRIGKLSLGPNDVVVVKCEMTLDKEQMTVLRGRVHEQLKAAGIDNKVLILTHGADLQVLELEPPMVMEPAA